MPLAKDYVGISAVTAQSLQGSRNVSVTAAGSILADATQLNASIVIVAGADGTVGVKLPQVGQGDVTIWNNAASALKVYGGQSTVAIGTPGTGLGTAGVAFSLAANQSAKFIFASTTQVLAIKSA